MHAQATQSIGLAVLLTFAAGVDTAPAQVAPDEPPGADPDGYALSLGGGVTGFFDDDLAALAGPAGFWELRGQIGTRRSVGLEVAYLGQASTLAPRLGPARRATLLGTGAEALLRADLGRVRRFRPYLVAGVGWRRYDVTGGDFSTSAEGVADADDVVELPVGAGVRFRARRVLADLRVTLRGAMNEDLVLGTPDHPAGNDFMSDDDAFVAMHAWQAGARLGYEF